MKNVHPVYGTGIQTLEHKSPPIATRPNFPPLPRLPIVRVEHVISM